MTDANSGFNFGSAPGHLDTGAWAVAPDDPGYPEEDADGDDMQSPVYGYYTDGDDEQPALNPDLCFFTFCIPYPTNYRYQTAWDVVWYDPRDKNSYETCIELDAHYNILTGFDTPSPAGPIPCGNMP